MQLTALLALLTATTAVAAPALNQQYSLDDDVLSININIELQEEALGPRFGLIAVHSGSNIHFQSLNANGRAFWIGKKTSTYCPSPPVPPPACPPGNETVVGLSGQSASLDVNVPGGQYVYVEPSGALGFTQAHSGSYPPGSSFSPFVLKPGGSFPSFHFIGQGATDWLACPTGDGKSGPYKIYANVHGFNQKDCIGLLALAIQYQKSGPAAWQYI